MPPPVIPRFTILRDLPRLARRPIDVFQEYLARHGNDFLLRLGTRTTHFTVDPDLIQHVLQRNHRNYHKSEIQTDQLARYLGRGLLTNNGESWLAQRRLIQPGFHRKRLAAITAEMQNVIAKECRLRAAEPSCNLFAFNQRLAFRIIARAIFTDGFDAQETKALNDALDRVQAYVIYPVRMTFLRKPLRWLGLERKYLAISADVRRRILARITARRGAEPRDDLLQMLLDSRDADTGRGMTDDQLIDEIMILFAAGYETSANALSWTLYLLLRHPEELEKVRQEIASVSAAGPIDFDRARELTYLTQVIEESMRLYPPAWITDRVALADDAVGKHRLDAGLVVGIFIYGVHRSPEHYEAPEAFRPERMATAAKKTRHPFSYLPFGGGPRLCIGNHFALLEMQLALAHLLQHYRIEALGKLRKVDPKPVITLHLKRAPDITIKPLPSI